MNVEFWGGPEDDNLSDTSLDDYIERSLDEYPEDAEPVEILVHGYRRKVVSEAHKKRLAASLLEDVLEDLDEAYAGEDMTDVTEPMRTAAHTFVDTVVDNYHVWQCHEVEQPTVNVKEWRAKRRG